MRLPWCISLVRERLLFFCIFVRCLSNSTQRVYEDRQSLIAQYWESSVRFACVP